MSQFFSFICGPDGQKYYLNADERHQAMNAGLDPDDADVIAYYFGISAKPPYVQYTYNPFSEMMSSLHHPESDDSDHFGQGRCAARAWVDTVDIAALVPGVIIKQTVTLKSFPDREVTDEDNELINKWAKIYAAFKHSAANIHRHVSCEIEKLGVSAGVVAAARQAVFMRQTYPDPISMFFNSRFAADEAYISSFFNLKFDIDGIDSEGHDNPMWPVIELMESGLIPMFDGHTWSTNRIIQVSLT